MADESAEALLFGQALTDLPPHGLADALRRVGIQADVRESSLRAGGTYLRVCGDGDADCSLERVAPGEWSVHDGGGARAPLEDLAGALSAALTGMGVRHRLELYVGDDAPAAYFHHQWPPPAG